MPLLRAVTTEVLKEAGVLHQKANGKFSHILDEHGLSLENTASRLRELAESSDQNIRFRANELVIKAHGILKDDDEKQTPSITFVIQSDNVNLLQILTPR